MTHRETVRELSDPASRLVPEQQAFLQLVVTHDRKMLEVKTLLKAHGLSEPQYNVLRILRGAGRGGLPCQEIGARLLTRHPDITRLVDGLEGLALVTRERGADADRRVVMNHITPKGLRLLAGLDGPVLELHRSQFSSLSRAELRELKRLLVKSRNEQGGSR